MKDTIRTFIAIKIVAGERLTQIIGQLKKSLKGEEIRWVDAGNLHLTLRFLGETHKEQVSEIKKILESVSRLFSPFQFEINGTGVFKNKMHPGVLFLSVEKNQTLLQLAGEIQSQIESLGFETSEKSFNPHLTLGRMKYIENKDAFYALVKKYSEIKIQQVTVSEIVFYKSILSSAGPVYEPIEIVKLNKL